MTQAARAKIEGVDPVVRTILRAVLTLATLIVSGVIVAMATGARTWANDINDKVTVIGTQFVAFTSSFAEYKQRQERSEAEHTLYRREIDGKLTGIVDRLTKLEESRRATERFGVPKP